MISKNTAGWHYFDNDGDTVLVFVHGVMSNSSDCWKSQDSFWPTMVYLDKRLNKLSIYLAEYYTEYNSGTYGISECSSEVFSKISSIDSNCISPPIEKKNIIFVCHSLGGIVVRHLLDINQTAFANKKVGLILMASPSLGSSYADLLAAPIQFYKNRTASQLKQMNGFLTDLDDRFKRLIEDKNRKFELIGIEAVENHSIIRCRYLPDFFNPVVKFSSANRYFLSRTIPDTDHISIVKPNCHSHPSHEFLIKFIAENFSKIDLEKPQKAESKSDSTSEYINLNASVLFDVLDKSSVNYFLVRPIDNKIRDIVQLSSFWAYGMSRPLQFGRLIHNGVVIYTLNSPGQNSTRTPGQF